jgi:cell division septum initiation protein DivIVA
MSLAPVELPHVELRRAFYGYRASSVELRDKVEQLQADVERHREVETLLRETLVSAERSAQELKSQAERDAERIVEEAHRQARSITHDALGERERLVADAARVRAILESALAIVDEVPGEASQAA